MKNKRFDKQRRRLKKGESQRANGTYDYRWTDKYGHRHSVYAPTLEELREKEEEILADERDGLTFYGKNYTLNDMYYKWISIERGLKGSTLSNYTSVYEKHVLPTIGRMKVRDIKKSDIKRFYLDMFETKKYRFSSVKNIHSVLMDIFKFAVDENAVRMNVSQGALDDITQMSGWTAKSREALSVAHEQIFIKEAHKSRYKHLLLLLLGTGMRIGEALALQWDDIDFEKGNIQVSHSLSKYGTNSNVRTHHISMPKTKNSLRNIPMFGTVKNVLLELKQAHDERVHAGVSMPELDGYKNFVFYTNKGAILSYQHVKYDMEKVNERCRIAAEKANIEPFPNISFHILRHTFATRLYESNVKLKFIQHVLGHSSSNVTLGIYVSATEDMKNDQMEYIKNNNIFNNESWGIYAK